MQAFITWSGWLFGVVSLGINVFQWLGGQANRKLNRERLNQLAGIKGQLAQIRALHRAMRIGHRLEK